MCSGSEKVFENRFATELELSGTVGYEDVHFQFCSPNSMHVLQSATKGYFAGRLSA